MSVPHAAGVAEARAVSRTASEGRSAASSLVRQSAAGAVWTVVSRLSGLVRIIIVGAVLGATYLGNTYQGINALPNLVYYQLLAGSLFASLLVPPVVRHVTSGDAESAEALVGGFLGAILVLSAGAVVLLFALGPVLVRVFAAGVADPGSAAAERHIGLILLFLFAPQILLYAVAGTGAAVMNAHGRFALAAAAPTLENLGMIVTIVAAGVAFGAARSIADVSTSELVLLGLGTTGAVGLHAAAQWIGARGVGVTMRPTAGWRDPEIRRVLRRIASALGYTGLAALQLLAALVLANRVAGGLVGFQVALNFFYLPTAIITWPIVRALTPRLAGLHQRGERRALHEECRRALGLATFVTMPVAVAYAVGAPEIAQAVAFGHLRTATGLAYISLSLIALAPAVLGETWFTIGNYAFYAQENVRAPLAAMAVRVGTAAIALAAAGLAGGSTVLLLVGGAVSVGSLAGAGFVGHQLSRDLPPAGFSLARSCCRTVVGCCAMVACAVGVWLVAAPLAGSWPGETARLAIATLAGAAAFIGAEVRLGAPELALVREGARRYAGRCGVREA